MSNGMILTNAGRNLLAKALAGKTLHFTRALTGNGDLGSRKPAELTALISPKRELPIVSMSAPTSLGTCEVVLEMSNKNLAQGFFVKEYGLYARDPDTGAEVLYSYCNKGSEAGYLEGDNGVDIINYVLSLVTVIDQAPNITANITNNNQYVTYSRLDTRIGDMYAASTETPTGFWSYYPAGDKRIRPSTLEQTRKALYGDLSPSQLNSRIEVLEDALAQTMLQLEILQDFPGYSHFIAEDFKDTSMIDTFSAQLSGLSAGDDSADCSDITGLLPGVVCTISDGTKSENVQVMDTSTENGSKRIIFKGKISNSYANGKAQIFRTSAVITQGESAGAGVTAQYSWTPNLSWQGTGASEIFSVNVDTSLNSMGNYDVSGYISADSTGRVSLSL